MSLTKFGLPDWRPGMPSVGHQESPAQHRFPVWWTGDGVPLQGSVESMVDAGVHGFKAYVHSDCGGDYRSKEGGDLLRWTAHCAFGTIHRFHGSDHRSVCRKSKNSPLPPFLPEKNLFEDADGLRLPPPCKKKGGEAQLPCDLSARWPAALCFLLTGAPLI